jgi:hypothetical protein
MGRLDCTAFSKTSLRLILWFLLKFLQCELRKPAPQKVRDKQKALER